jgi:ribosomal protein L11 methylase PrmA
LQGKKQNDENLSTKKIEKQSIPKESIMAIMKNLKKIIEKSTITNAHTEWGEYYEKMLNYSDKAFACKAKIVRDYLDKIEAKSICDMGANMGEFSKVAGGLENSYVVAYDIDHTAVDKHYNALKANNVSNVLPLILDLTNPSPAIGWANTERMSVDQRAEFDCILLLAVIHHLAISNNLPFDKIASYFSSLTKHLIIEFVPKGDSQVDKLLLNRKDIFKDYTLGRFEEEFSKYFNILEKQPIEESSRVVYLMKSK